jgi:Lrp/AsnC family transcriptional regulator, regulator for asnA, asnC and gidA
MERTGRALSDNGVELDDVDRAIIRVLQADGRTPYSKLGPEVGLSQAAVRQRVQRLIDRDVMQIVAVTDPAVLGLGLQAMIGVRIEGDVRAAADAIAQVDDVEYVVITAGRYDLLVEVVAADAARLLDLVDGAIRKVQGVASTEILTYLRLVKQTYTWGVH